jgi:two-component system, chemotaxis family, sensor kinase CheA
VLKRLPIRLKLMLLAGVPVIGALILAAIIARDAFRQAESAAAIGSIEDLASLSAQMSGLVHALQFERNELSLYLGQKKPKSSALSARMAQTDAARKQLGEFLATRKISSLPPRLARDLKTAEERLRALQRERADALSGEQPIDELLGYYQATDMTLISATAALSQLADDSQLMRAISALVTVLQIKERASQEHALLSHVFAINEFPAGTYKDFVALMTEEATYVNVLHVNATDSVNEQFKRLSQGPEFARTAELRKVAVDTMSDDFHVNPEEWSNAQGQKIERLRRMEIALNETIKVAALSKVSAATRSVRLSYSLGGGVIVLSALLAGLIARGVSRSVASLARAAASVQKEQDFGIRAEKTSEDELGRLADVFNEMLAGIQGRDEELRLHGENLERLVEQRTALLQKRNDAMRLVLDNVEQGLATIELDGSIAPERSRVFDEWFGVAQGRDSFADHLARNDPTIHDSLEMAWQQVTDGFLPVECTIDQMPRHIAIGERHYDLAYKAILEQENLRGALLVVSDVTDALERMNRDTEQRELIGVFERIMLDRAGFMEFCIECQALIDGVVTGRAGERQVLMRAIHTLKGNCGIFGVSSVAAVAHRVETQIIDSGSLPSAEQLAELTAVWRAFSERVARLTHAEGEAVLEISYEELQELQAATQARLPYEKLADLLERVQYERAVVRLRRIAEQAKSLAHRLGKGELDVQIRATPEVRFEAERWGPFWLSFVHVVRNALDHGIEGSSERLAAGKPAHGQIRLVTVTDGQTLTVEISDDGRGVNWPSVREKARERGLPHESEKDLVDALFRDGLSTSECVSEISGRGVGMSAVRDAAHALGGAVTIISTIGVGTTVCFRFPIAQSSPTLHRMGPKVASQSARPILLSATGAKSPIA